MESERKNKVRGVMLLMCKSMLQDLEDFDEVYKHFNKKCEDDFGDKEWDDMTSLDKDMHDIRMFLSVISDHYNWAKKRKFWFFKEDEYADI